MDAYLMIYDIGSASASRLADWTLGFQDGGVYLATPQWDDIGILNPYFTFLEYPQAGYNVQLIDPTTSICREFSLLEYDINDSENNPYPESVYMPDAASIVVVPHKVYFDIYRVDAATSETTLVTELDQYAVQLGDFQIIYDRTFRETVFAYLDQPVKRVGGDTFAVTPNGDGLLFTEFDRLYSFTNNVPTEIARFPLQEITLVGAAAEPSPLNPVFVDTINPKIGTCNLIPRLMLGQNAKVIQGLGANILREVPGLDGTEIMEIPEGAIAYSTYLPPRCADGYVWHYVVYEGTNAGWTAEGDLDGTYWLEPVN